MRSVVCPQCDAPLDVPPNRTQFFCQYCGSTVVADSHFESAGPTDADGSRRSELPEIPAEPPDLSRFRIDKSGDELTIEWDWKRWAALFMIPFALFWNGITWTVFAGFMFSGDAPWFVFPFFIPHMAIGAFMAYFAVATLINRTTVTVRSRILSVRHGPLPWRSPEPIPAEDVEQLYVKEKISRGKNGTSVTYELVAIRGRDAKRITLVSGEQDANTPRAVERMIEVHLDIEDRRVSGEHRG